VLPTGVGADMRSTLRRGVFGTADRPPVHRQSPQSPRHGSLSRFAENGS